VRQVGYLQGSYQDARSTKHKMKRDFDIKSLCLQERRATFAKCQVSVASTEGNRIFMIRIGIGCPWLCFIVWHLLSQNMQWLFSTQSAIICLKF